MISLSMTFVKIASRNSSPNPPPNEETMKEKQDSKGDCGRNPVIKVSLSDKEMSELCDRVVHMARGRKGMLSELNEPDFFTGAMAVMEALSIPCPMWVMQIMLNGSVLDSK